MWLMLLPALAMILLGLLRARRLPPNRPALFHGRGAVVCLGASTVQGNVSYNFVDELARRLPDRSFVNAGINGQTSAQVLARVPEVTACHPTHVIVMVGANDLFAIVGARMSGGRHATFDEYRTNLTATVRELGDTRVALMSIQPLGEEPDSRWNQEMGHLNEIIREVATEYGATYLPFNERMTELVGRGRPFQDSAGRVLVAMALHLGLGVSLDRIGRWNGFRAHTEGLHLASPAGLLAADLAEEFLLSEVPGAAGDS